MTVKGSSRRLEPFAVNKACQLIPSGAIALLTMRVAPLVSFKTTNKE